MPGLEVQENYERDHNLVCIWSPPFLEFPFLAQELMVSLAAFDLKEKSKYSQNLLKIVVIFVDISPEIIPEVSLLCHIVHGTEPNSITALYKQRSLHHAKITPVLQVSISLTVDRTNGGSTWSRFSYFCHCPVLSS